MCISLSGLSVFREARFALVGPCDCWDCLYWARLKPSSPRLAQQEKRAGPPLPKSRLEGFKCTRALLHFSDPDSSALLHCQLCLQVEENRQWFPSTTSWSFQDALSGRNSSKDPEGWMLPYFLLVGPSLSQSLVPG